MKTLFTTTAMVLALGIPVAGFAQTAAPATTTEPATSPMMEMREGTTGGFMAMRGASDMLATDLIGHEVFARRTPMDGTAATTGGMSGTGMASMARADLDQMDSIGEINDMIVSADGSVMALVIGVGGFIGMGEQDVAVTMDQVSFATDADNPEEMYIVVNTSGEMLKTSPAFDRMGAMDGTGTTGALAVDATTEGSAVAPGTMAERERLAAPTMTRDGYNPVAVTEVSIDQLIGKSVFGVDDNDVGNIDDVIADDSGAIQMVVINFGGFLGIGTTQVALDYDELTILSTEGFADIRVYVDATEEQIKAMPVYVAAN